MALAKGWDRESADLFIHDTGARISRTTYRGKMAWWFFPASLDSPAVEYAATDAGREEAFAISGKQLPKSRPKRKAKASVAKNESKDEEDPDKKDPGANPDEEEEDKEEDGE